MNFGIDDLEGLSSYICRMWAPKQNFLNNPCVCVCIYIYIYIVIHRQTVSLYQNSSVWLNSLDSRSWDRKLVDWNANPRFYHSATRKPTQAKEI